MTVRAMLWPLASLGVLVPVYYLLPLGHSSRWLAITILMTGLAALIGLLVTGQMVIDVIVVGLGGRVIVGAVRVGRGRAAATGPVSPAG